MPVCFFRLKIFDAELTGVFMAASVPSLTLMQPIDQDKRLFVRRALLPSRLDGLWQIDSGIVRTMTWLEDGTVLTLGIWGAGDVIGKALSKIDPYQIECLTPVEATLLSIEDGHHLPEALIAQIQQLEELAVIRSHKRVEEALMQLLFWLARKFGREVDRGHLLDLRLTHQDLSELLGSTRVTVTRILSQLEEQGLINRLPKQQILVSETELWHYEI
jgi:CRP-like cAMP-binding protein